MESVSHDLAVPRPVLEHQVLASHAPIVPGEVTAPPGFLSLDPPMWSGVEQVVTARITLRLEESDLTKASSRQLKEHL